MNWQFGLILVLVVAVFVPWLFGEIAARFNRPDEIDFVAERKRRIARRARQQSREMAP